MGGADNKQEKQEDDKQEKPAEGAGGAEKKQEKPAEDMGGADNKQEKPADDKKENRPKAREVRTTTRRSRQTTLSSWRWRLSTT